MAVATIRSGAPVWREDAMGETHALVESSVGRFACRRPITRLRPGTPRGARCIDCLEVVGIEISIDLGADRTIDDDVRALSNASEGVAAAAVLVDLVIDDLGRFIQTREIALAMVDLRDVRSSLHGKAGELRAAALRWDPR